MKTILFTYDSPVGQFWIHPEPAGRVRLRIGREELKSYKSPTEAARAVKERRTGYEPWDTLTDVPPPPGLNRWRRPPPQ